MGTADGAVVGLTKLVDNGPDSQRLNIVLVAEGFMASELGTFATRSDEFVASLQAEPWFPTLGAAINVFRLDVSSTDSGADDPVECDDGSTGSGAAPATFFDASFCISGIRRCLQVDTALVRTTLTAQLPQWQVAAVLVNTSQRGGCANGNVFSTALSSDWREVVLHELGHAAFGLADEYSTWAGCASGETDHDTPSGTVEPFEPNITKQTTLATLKWSNLVALTTPLPTMSNPDCASCDERADTTGVPGLVGLFEGAGYYHCDIYRPSYSCKMRDSSQPFCAVCIQGIARRLATFRPPTPQLEVRTGDGSNLLEFGDVAQGLTMHRSFEVRNVRSGVPGELRVTVGAPTAPYTLAPGTETTFVLPAPVTQPYTSRPVFVAFTAPEVGGPDFFGSLDVSSPDLPASTAQLNLHARSVPPPTVDTVLVVDRSGSMGEPTGIPATTKSDVAISASNLYVSLLRDDDQIGLVRYNNVSVDPADVLVPIITAGTNPGGAGRAAMQAALTPANLAPSGATSIGAGIIRGSAVLDAASADARALVVLTDGIQNTAPDIPAARAVVETKSPRQRVFAVGLGLNQLEDKLAQIASVTNGVAHITGDLVGWKEFLLQKLYVQILSDAADEAFVKDPVNLLLPGQRLATPVRIGDVDVAADFIVVLRRTPVHPKYTRMWLEAPNGTIVTPADAGPFPNVEFVDAPDHQFFRWLFPAFPADPSGHVGTWKVWVENAYRAAGNSELGTSAAGNWGGLPLYFTVMAKARSDLRLGGRIEQVGYAPGSPLHIVLEPVLYGQPIALDADPVVTVVRPDGVMRSITLASDGAGAYAGDFTDTPLVGPYHAWTEVQATSPSGVTVTRHRHLSGVIFRAGDGGGGNGSGHGNGGGGGNGGNGNGGGFDPACCKEAADLIRRFADLLEKCCRDR